MKDRGYLVKKGAALGKIAQDKAERHGHQTNATQLARLHFQDLPQPALHGLRGRDIRKPLENENKTDERDKQFHNRSNTRKLQPSQPAQRY